MTYPQDIKKPFLNIARRLQSVARQPNQGVAVIIVAVAVDSNGDVLGWLEPEVRKVEPKSADHGWLLKALTQP
jgi:hypothetical protein